MRPRPYLIGIAGPSGAGKSYLAEHLVGKLKDATILPIDAYYPDLSQLSLEERSALNFDDPKVLDSALLLAHVESLSRGEEIQQPIYDFANHTRTAQARTVQPVPFVIVEGLFALYWPELRKLLQTRVYVDMSDAICLQRRIARDVEERGRTAESVEKQFRTSALPMANLYVRPTAQFADVVRDGSAEVRQSVAAILAHVRLRRQGWRHLSGRARRRRH
jgi:uridine kinase